MLEARTARELQTSPRGEKGGEEQGGSAGVAPEPLTRQEEGSDWRRNPSPLPCSPARTAGKQLPVVPAVPRAGTFPNPSPSAGEQSPCAPVSAGTGTWMEQERGTEL